MVLARHKPGEVRAMYPPHPQTPLQKMNLLPRGRCLSQCPGLGSPSFAPEPFGSSATLFSQVSSALLVPLSHPSCCVGLSGRRCLLCASPGPRALLLLQPLEQEQHVVRELVPWPPHAAELHRAQAGVGRLVPLGAAHLIQEQPGAVRVHVHQVQENTLENSRKKGKKSKDKAFWLAPNRVIKS